MYKPVLNQSDVRIADRKTVYQGFYQVQKVKLQHRLFQGGWSKVLDRELVLRLPAVAVLMYDATTDQVVLIEQFRVGAMTHEEGPWQLEMVAGMIDTLETPEQVAVRECKEESGAIIDQNDLELVWNDPFKKPSYLFALVAGKLSQTNRKFVTKSKNKENNICTK